MRRKEERSKVKPTTKQSSTAHPRRSGFPKETHTSSCTPCPHLSLVTAHPALTSLSSLHTQPSPLSRHCTPCPHLSLVTAHPALTSLSSLHTLPSPLSRHCTPSPHLSLVTAHPALTSLSSLHTLPSPLSHHCTGDTEQQSLQYDTCSQSCTENTQPVGYRINIHVHMA